MKALLMKKLKHEKIFGYGSYGEFFNGYFKKNLVVVEDLNREKKIKDARRKYERRWRGGAPRPYGFGRPPLN